MTVQEINVLFIGSDNGYSASFTEMLSGSEKVSFHVEVADSLNKAREIYNSSGCDIVITDINLADGRGKDTLKELLKIVVFVPVICLIDSYDESLCVEVSRMGIEDCIAKKEMPLKFFEKTVLYAIERKKTDTSLKIFRGLIDQFADSIVVVKPGSGEIFDFNKQFNESRGYTREEMFKMKVTDFDCLFDSNMSWGKHIGELRKKENLIFESRHKRKDGKTFPVEVSVRYAEVGERDYLLAVVRDITERKATRYKISQLTSAVEQSPVAVAITDLEGTLTYVNPGFLDLTGFTREEAIGRNPRILKSGKVKEIVYRNLWNTVTSGKTWKGEFINKKKNGEIYWESASITPIKDSDGTVAGYIKVAENITNKKKTEIELMRLASFPQLNPNPILEIDHDGHIKYLNPAAREKFPELSGKSMKLPFYKEISDLVRGMTEKEQYYLKKEIAYEGKVYELDVSYFSRYENTRIYFTDVTEKKRIEELKDEFVSTVSHELRTPLTSIREGISQVLDGILGPTTEAQREFLSISLDDVDRLKRIIDDLLDISRIESGKMKISRSLVNINDILTGIINIFSAQAKNKGLELKCDIPENGIWVFADKDKLTQIFVNLVGNSCKFTDKGHIFISVKDKGEKIECSVSDTGVGIKTEDIPKIFDKFQQFGRVSGPGQKGTGLGLAISRNIIDMHKGSIHVESEYGEGTRFVFVLPKFTEKELMIEKANDLIKAASVGRHELSFILFKVRNADHSEKLKMKKELGRIVHDLYNISKDNLRFDNDSVMKDANSILLALPGTCKADSEMLSERIMGLFEIYLKDEALNKKVHILCNVSTYPKDGDNAEVFIKAGV